MGLGDELTFFMKGFDWLC